MKKLKSIRLWRKLAIAYWTLYGRLHRGWRREYADYLRRWNGYKRNWQEEKKKLIRLAREHHPELLRRGKLPWYRLLDYWLCYAFLGARADSDYYFFLFPQHGWRYRRRSVTNRRTRFAAFWLNTPEAIELTDSKAATAAYWADWFKRGWCTVSQEKPVTAEELRRVLGGETRWIAKPDRDYGGHGIFVLDVRDEAELAEAAARLNTLDREYIVEPYIRQTGLLHELNPSSLNTARLITARHADGSIQLLTACIRVGHSGSVVDNASSGGILFRADPRTGEIAEGYDYAGAVYSAHPETGKQITGLRIPRWEEFRDFCVSAHRHGPEGLALVGWDVCVSDDMICMIEVNVSPGICPPLPWIPDPWRAVKVLLDEKDRGGR